MAELPLKHVIILIPTRDGLTLLTRNCVQESEQSGARRLELGGCSDVALARSTLLTRALESASEHVTVFLLVDDDMVFTPAQAVLLSDQALGSKYPVSAVYATSAGTLAHTRRADGRWNSGLGCMAVSRAELQRVADALPRVKGVNGQLVWPICESKAIGDTWMSEDYTFCDRFGGALLANFGVGHVKRVPLYPDAASIDQTLHPKKK